MFIRQAKLQDLYKITGIISQCSEQLLNLGIEQWDSNYPTIEMISDDIIHGYIYVGIDESSDILIATVSINAQKNNEHHAHILWEKQTDEYMFFNRLAVLPGFQGKGCASQLMDFAEIHAEKAGAESLRLDARTGYARVVEMYKNRGYLVRGQVSYRNGTRHYSAMEKIIPATKLKHIQPPYKNPLPAYIQYQQVLAIRKEVFVVGQNVDPAIDQDGKDSNLEHFLIVRGNEPAGCLRFQPLDNSTVKLERIAIIAEFRGLGLGKRLVQAAVMEAGKRNYKKLIMYAQFYLLDYYGKLGFTAVGEPFYEANIKHIEMIQTI
ncbi:MAG: GNAT family N-acetyltransferase [Spirochaetes bacterium]|nr:GNAT family N-acetyltransferase [Spirochaetota bacterium]